MIPRTMPGCVVGGWPHGGERRRRGPTCHQPATTTPTSTRAQMVITGDKLRLAVGIFYEPPRLSRAIAELFAEGIGAQDMCLVGMPSAFAAARQDETVADGGQVAGVLAG